MIQIKNIKKTFNPNTPQEVKALQNVSLVVQKGEYLVIIGANGSGKSTLLDVIAGNFLADEGSILLENQDVTQFADYQRSKWLARMFQNPLSGTASELTVLENFRIASLRTRKKGLKLGIDADFREEVFEKIKLLGLGLEQKINQPIGSLSGGQRQSLTLAMALMDTSKILLMDEPTSALDPKSAQMIMEKSAEFIQNFQLTALLVTHDLRDAQQYGNRLIEMKNGNINRDIAESKKNLSAQEIFGWFSEKE